MDLHQWAVEHPTSHSMWESSNGGGMRVSVHSCPAPQLHSRCLRPLECWSRANECRRIGSIGVHMPAARIAGCMLADVTRDDGVTGQQLASKYRDICTLPAPPFHIATKVPLQPAVQLWCGGPALCLHSACTLPARLLSSSL